jgi:hypothetical protein
VNNIDEQKLITDKPKDIRQAVFGRLYSDLGEERKALEYYELALPLSKASGDHRASKPVN